MKRILVVEDDFSIRVALRRSLEDHGYDVVSVTNGIDALVRLKEHAPDVMLLDLRPPLMSGAELLRRMGQNESLARIPVVVVSAYLDSIALPPDLKPVACLPKPIEEGILLDAVATAAA